MVGGLSCEDPRPGRELWPSDIGLRFGFSDVCGDGLPVWHESHQPRKGKSAEPLLESYPQASA